jgi:hypothetical protein
MRLLLKLLMKLVNLGILVVAMSLALRFGQCWVSQGSGGSPVGGAHFSSEESDLMSTVFKSALRLVTGKADRKELAGELSDKLYGDRGGAESMSELGIDLVKPGENPSATPGNATSPAGPRDPAKRRAATAKQHTVAADSPAQRPAGDGRAVMGGRVVAQVKANSTELALVPVGLLIMLLVHRIRRHRNPGTLEFQPVVLPETDSGTYEMTHAVQGLSAEDFEMLVAFLYQRQGYRVSMPAGLSGGRGGDFTLQQKLERILVKCRRSNADHRVPVERVRELHETVAAAGATRGMYVASCGFTWDARNYAKANKVTLINARTLDALIGEARDTPNLLDVAQWASQWMAKVELTEPLCPACGARMDELSVSSGLVWVCSQRPDCRGRRSGRKYQKPARAVPSAQGA